MLGCVRLAPKGVQVRHTSLKRERERETLLEKKTHFDMLNHGRATRATSLLNFIVKGSSKNEELNDRT